jgi:hypothetical protein
LVKPLGLHVFPEEYEEVKNKVSPAQRVVGPEGVMIGIDGLILSVIRFGITKVS